MVLTMTTRLFQTVVKFLFPLDLLEMSHFMPLKINEWCFTNNLHLLKLIYVMK